MTNQIRQDESHQQSMISMHALQSAAPDEWDADEAKPAGNPALVILHMLAGRLVLTACLSLTLAGIVAIAAFLAIKPTYQSTGLVQVKANKAGILYKDNDDSRLRLFDAFVSSEASYLESRPVLERALTTKSFEKLTWAPTTESFDRLRHALEVKSKGGLITVACKHPDPNTAAAMLNAVLDAYEELHVERSRREDSVRERQLEARENELLSRLSDLEDTIREVGQEYSVQSMASAHVKKIAQIQDVDDRINELANSVAQRESELSATELDVGDEELKRLVVLDQAMADLTFEKAKRVALLASLPASLAENHPAVYQRKLGVDSLDKAIEDRRAQIATLGTSGALTKSGENASSSSLDALRRLLARLESRHSDLQSEAKALNSRLIELESSKSEHAYARELLEETRLALERVRVESQNTLPGTIDIRVRGSVPTQPASDKRRPLAAAGACGGSMLGLLGVVGYGFVNRRIRFRRELELAVPSAEIVADLPDATEASAAHFEKFNRAVHELRTWLQMHRNRNHHSHGVVALMGTREKTGCSTLSQALANSFAASGESAIVITADAVQSRAGQEGSFETEHDASLSLHIAQQMVGGNWAHRVHSQSLWDSVAEVAPEGHQICTEVNISVDMLQKLLQRKAAEFDNVVIDIGSFKDSLVARFCAALTEHVLLVVPQGELVSHCKAANDSITRIQPNVQLVFNTKSCNEAAKS